MSGLRMVINALKRTQIKLKNWISPFGALFLFALWARGTCSSCSASSIAAITQLQLLDAYWHKRCVSAASFRLLRHIARSHRFLIRAICHCTGCVNPLHIFILYSRIMSWLKMLIASKCCHTWVMCNHSQNREGSHRRRRNFLQVILQKRLVSFAVDAVFVHLKYSQVVQFEYCNAGNSLIDSRREFFKHFINSFGSGQWGCSSRHFLQRLSQSPISVISGETMWTESFIFNVHLLATHITVLT